MVLNISRVSFDQHYRVLYNDLSLLLFQPTTATGSGSASGNPPTVRLTPSSHRMSIPSGSGWRPSGSNPVMVVQGISEQNLPQLYLKVLFWLLQQERGSKGGRELSPNRQHKIT